MKLSLLPIFYITLTVATAIPTAKGAGELRKREKVEGLDFKIPLSCATDGFTAGVAFQRGGDNIKNNPDFKGHVHDEVKRDISSPEKRDLSTCISCVSDAIIRRMSDGQDNWEAITEQGAMDCNPNVCTDEQMVDVAEAIQKVGGICASLAFAYFGFGNP